MRAKGTVRIGDFCARLRRHLAASRSKQSKFRQMYRREIVTDCCEWQPTSVASPRRAGSRWRAPAKLVKIQSKQIGARRRRRRRLGRAFRPSATCEITRRPDVVVRERKVRQLAHFIIKNQSPVRVKRSRAPSYLHKFRGAPSRMRPLRLAQVNPFQAAAAAAFSPKKAAAASRRS